MRNAVFPKAILVTLRHYLLFTRLFKKDSFGFKKAQPSISSILTVYLLSIFMTVRVSKIRETKDKNCIFGFRYETNLRKS